MDLSFSSIDINASGAVVGYSIGAGEAVLRAVLQAYRGASGIPVLCNTSANFNGSGFFPDVASAMSWGRVPAVWSEGVLYLQEATADAT